MVNILKVEIMKRFGLERLECGSEWGKCEVSVVPLWMQVMIKCFVICR